MCAGSCHAIAIVHEAKSGQTRPEEAVIRLLHGFMAMSGLLVASTLLLTLSFRLPAALYGTGEVAEARIAEYLGFANVLSVFWGAVFTLTLVAVYAPHALALQSLSGIPLGQFLGRGIRNRLFREGRATEDGGGGIDRCALAGGVDGVPDVSRGLSLRRTGRETGSPRSSHSPATPDAVLVGPSCSIENLQPAKRTPFGEEFFMLRARCPRPSPSG